MRVTLIHNPGAGTSDAEALTTEDVAGALRDAGHLVEVAGEDARSRVGALHGSSGVVLVSGGDGTVSEMIRLVVASERDVRLGILPLGTANNVARSLGIEGDVQAIVARLATARERRLDVAVVRAEWGTTRFVESAGIGVFAAMLRDAAIDERANGAAARDRARTQRADRFRAMFERARPRFVRIDADGDDLSGTYHQVLVQNTPWFGPSLAFASDADAGDGWLDLVLIGPAEREALGAYLDGIASGRETPLAVAPRRVRRVRMQWGAPHGHADDRPWPSEPAGTGAAGAPVMAEVTVGERAVRVLVPGGTAE